MIIVVASVRGAPGGTTWSLLLAAAWPYELGRERVVLEADPDGGVVGARYELGVEPGVVSLVSALRRATGSIPVHEHGRRVADGVWVLPGPEHTDQARAVWHASAAIVAEQAATDERVWVVDAGRVGAHDPQAEFVRRAAAVVLVSGCRREDLVQLPGSVALLGDLAAPGVVHVLFVGKLDYRLTEIADFVGAEVLGVVAHDDDAITVAASAASGGRGRRSVLWRSALDVAATVAQRAVATRPVAPPGPAATVGQPDSLVAASPRPVGGKERGTDERDY